MNTKARIGLILLAIAGIAVSVHLTMFHFELLSNPDYQSICNINATIDCDKVNTSPYAKIWGIPLGLYGVGFYTVILVLGAFSFSKKEPHKHAPELIFGLSSLAVLLSIGLAYISAEIIGAWCLFCIGLYAINLGLFGTSLAASGGGIKAVIGRLDKVLFSFYRNPLVYISLMLFVGISVIGGGIYKEAVRAQEAKAVTQFVQKKAKEERQAKTPAKQPGLRPGQGLQNETVRLELLGHEPIRGKPDAPIQIFLFSDFQCPYCARAAVSMDALVTMFPDEVAVIYKQYPLDDKCNPYMRSPMHLYSCDAAIATMCAGQQGHFWQLHDLIFQNQSAIKTEALERWAQSLNLDMGQFRTCTATDRDVILAIAHDIDQGKAIPISGTPAVFINGRRWKGPLEPDVLGKVVEELLASGATKTKAGGAGSR